MQNFLVTVQADLAGKWTLPAKEYRIQKASGEGVAARRAWTLYKKEPFTSRKRLDNAVIKLKRLGTL